MTRALGSDRVNESEIERANLFCATRQGGVTDLTRTCLAHTAGAARKARARKRDFILYSWRLQWKITTLAGSCLLNLAQRFREDAPRVTAISPCSENGILIAEIVLRKVVAYAP